MVTPFLPATVTSRLAVSDMPLQEAGDDGSAE
jgi:hypothetical protein